MRHHLFVGRISADTHGDQERTLKPPAELVGALEVYIRRPGAFGGIEDGQVGGTGVKPDVQNVVLFLPIRCGALRALEARGQQFFGGVGVPGVRAFLLKPFDDVAQSGKIFEPRLAIPAIENNQRHAPEALA